MRSAARYCYWTVATGEYAPLMEDCVRSARRAGVFKEFHVLTDRMLDGCECYEAPSFDPTGGVFKLHFMKAAISRLNYDWFLWIDADSTFMRDPQQVVEAARISPLHAPLELAIPSADRESEWKGSSLDRWAQVYSMEGLAETPHLASSAFWLVHHDAIDVVFDLGMKFWNRARAQGLLPDAGASLAYVTQMLGANADAHRLHCRPDLWAEHKSNGYSEPPEAPVESWVWQHECGGPLVQVRPAIVHRPGIQRDQTSVPLQAKPL